MEYLVILHTGNGDVRTRYPVDQQSKAIALWQNYVSDGKKASLLIE
jgi:hypothetical protein